MTMHTSEWPIASQQSHDFGFRLIAPASLTAGDRQKWDALGNDAEPGAFFSHRWFMEPVLQASTRWLAVVEQDGFWIGVMGLEQARRLGRLPVPIWRAVKDANQFLGLPLVRKGMSATFWRGLFTGLDDQRSSALGLYLPSLPADGPITDALRRWCICDGRPLELLRESTRAAFTGGPSWESDNGQQLSPARRRRLASLARQLTTHHGPIRFETASDAPSTAAWIDQFLSLERAGWKGAAKSAMADAVGTAQLFRTAVMGAARRNLANCLTLYAGDVPVAASVQFIDGHVGCGFKTTFDERYARYAPGIQLLLHITQNIAAAPGLIFDSCSLPDQTSINSLWPERRTIHDYGIALRGVGRHHLFAMLLRGRRVWNQQVKPLSTIR